MLHGGHRGKTKNAGDCAALWTTQFYAPDNVPESKLRDYGMYYVIQGIADEMLNANYSMICSDLTTAATETTSASTQQGINALVNVLA